MNKYINRSPNFTPKQVETLIYHLELRPELITPQTPRITKDGRKSHDGLLTEKDKQEIWDEIAKEINLAVEGHITGIIRTGNDIRKKWNDLKSRVKLRTIDLKTGKLLDSETPLSPLDERVLQLIAKTSASFNEANLPAFVHSLEHAQNVKSTSFDNKIEETADTCTIIYNTEQTESPIVAKSSVEGSETPLTVPHISGIPIITFSNPVSLQTLPNTANNMKIPRSFNAESLNQMKYQVNNEKEKTLALEMLSESQNEIKQELKSIKRLLFNISKQKRKRLEQEDEKIQLKKMKLFLMCKEQGVDFNSFISDFM